MAKQRDEEPRSGERWAGRPVQAAMLRVLALAVPIAAGVLASVIFSRVVHYPDGLIAVAGWWLAVFAISAAVVMVVERQCRRLLPLATLLKLSMIFPDKAPSRFGLALRAGSVKNLEQRVVEMRSRGVDDEPSRAAEQILELVGAMSVHDKGTRGHAERVRAYSDLLGVQMGLDEDERDRLRWAALLHDVGKVAVPSEVLNKPGKPDEDEWALIHRHPEEGAKLVAPLRHWLGEWVHTIEQHHERWDGQGYPHNLKGEEISRGARMVSVADSFEVMTAARSYKRPMDVKAARAELTNGAGSQFDPAAVRAFLNISLGRTRWMVGPMSWLAQLPFLQNMPGGVGGQVAGVVTRVAAAATLFASAAAPAAASGETAKPAHRTQQTTTMAVPGDLPVILGTPPASATTVPDGQAPAAPPLTTAVTEPPPPTPTATTTPPVSGPAPPASGPAPTTPPVRTTAPPPTAPPTTKPPGPNHPPVAVADSATGTSKTPFDIPVTANDYDPDGNSQLVFPITLSTNKVEKANISVSPDGRSIHYVPNDQHKGTWKFEYTLCDSAGACVKGQVTVTIT